MASEARSDSSENTATYMFWRQFLRSESTAVFRRNFVISPLAEHRNVSRQIISRQSVRRIFLSSSAPGTML